MNKEKLLRKAVLNKVVEFHKSKKKSRFIPGATAINYAGRVYDEEEMVNLVDSALDFWLTSGRYAAEFESKFASFLGLKHCLLVNSGSSANLLAISALTSPLLKTRRLRPGDEVITTACGFPTTLNAIIQNNLIPVFVDIELGTYNIDARKIEMAISKKTKAIFVAHTLGNPVNIDVIKKISKKYGLFFIEDNCDSLGSEYRGRYTGTFGDISTSSFYPPHHLTMGEGGALLTDNPLLKRIIASFRDWGRDCWCEPGRDDTCRKRFSQKFGDLPLGYDHKYVYSHIGYNLKATDMQAAIGVAQLKKLKSFIKARRKNFKVLYRLFSDYKDYFILPEATRESDPSWFGFPVMVKDEACFTRNDIVEHLEDKKIATRMLFGGNLIKQPAYKVINFRMATNLKNTDLVMNDLFWIGVYPGLNDEMLEHVRKTVRMFFKN